MVSEPEQPVGLADPRRLQALRRALEERAVLTYCTDDIGASKVLQLTTPLPLLEGTGTVLGRLEGDGLARTTHRGINAEARDAGITAAMLAMAACAPVGAASALRLPHTIAGQAARAIERLREAV